MSRDVERVHQSTRALRGHRGHYDTRNSCRSHFARRSAMRAVRQHNCAGTLAGASAWHRTLALRSETVGVGSGTSGDVGVGGAVTHTLGMSQTTLSARIAPPSPATERWGATATVAIVTVYFALVAWSQLQSFGYFLLITGGMIAGWVAFSEHRRVVAYNLTEYPVLLRRWRASALCLVCGHTQQLFVDSQL